MNFPYPNPKRIAVRLSKAGERAVRSGHPWVFDQSIESLSFEGQPGDLAVVFDSQRKFMGIGLYDPDSPIRIKLLHSGSPAQIDDTWFAAHLQTAVDRRAPLVASGTTGYRVVYGEGDGFPGLILDRYADTLVLKLYTAAWFPHLHTLLPLLATAVPHQRLVLRLARNVATNLDHPAIADGLILSGPPLSGPVEFVENGLLFGADVIHGHKTGFFFDQRDNRQLVRQYASGRRVLDLFAYAGGFSLYAAAGRAASVVSVDVSQPALGAARANFERNVAQLSASGFDLAQHHVRQGDVFDYLAAMNKVGEQFEMVIVDPPSFAKKQSEVPGALRAYAKLTRLALGVLAPNGLLVSASCSSRVPAETFYATVFEAAEKAERPLWSHKQTAHALDHPVPDHFPEGAYLKCLFASPID